MSENRFSSYVYSSGYVEGDCVMVASQPQNYNAHMQGVVGRRAVVVRPPNKKDWPADAVQVRIAGLGHGALDSSCLLRTQSRPPNSKKVSFVNPVVLRLRDNDGKWVAAGDTVHFSYGIPPVRVDAPIIERGCKLIGLCPGHNPPEFNLRSLRRYVGSWYKHNAQISGGTPSAESDC